MPLFDTWHSVALLCSGSLKCVVYSAGKLDFTNPSLEQDWVFPGVLLYSSLLGVLIQDLTSSSSTALLLPYLWAAARWSLSHPVPGASLGKRKDAGMDGTANSSENTSPPIRSEKTQSGWGEQAHSGPPNCEKTLSSLFMAVLWHLSVFF